MCESAPELSAQFLRRRIIMCLSRSLPLAVLALCLSGLIPATAQAAAKKYQVTGIVLSVSDDMIVVQKSDEKWEIDRTPDTKVDGRLKVGEKVTIYYHMTADKVESKGDDSK